MDLEDLISVSLEQDEWSLACPTFGKDNHLKVIGWSGKIDWIKFYILECSVCAEDEELFGGGFFRCRKGNLERGQIPCGCSKKPQLSIKQYSILCSRKAKELGYTFLGFVDEWKGVYTKVKILCEEHGEWVSAEINTLINMGNGCPGCRAEKVVHANTKSNEVMIQSFFDSGAFHPDTKFWRSNNKTSQGAKSYWYISCPECEEVGESISNNLQQGKRSCACSPHRQQEAYITQVIDEKDNTVAIKFGIARDSRQRIKQQSFKSSYKLHQNSIYTFPSVISCKKAEQCCLQELECGIVLKRDMPDGYTETTWPYNLEKIIEIYERNGGILKQDA